MPLRYKTIIGIALIEALMLAILVWNGLAILRYSNETELIKRARSTTSLFVSSIKNAIISNDLATIESSVEEIYKNKELLYIRVFGKNNILYSMRSRTKLSNAFCEDFSYQDAVQDGIFDTSLEIKEGVALFGRVEIGFSIQHIKDIVGEARRKSLVIASMEMALTALFSFLLGIYLTKSISNLATGAAEIEKGNLGYQIDYTGKDELAIAVKAFNRMSSRLKTLEAKYKKQNENLELLVKERTSELVDMQKELVAKAHKAGMADIASDIMHNVGNTLNSLKVSADLAYQAIGDTSSLTALQKANRLFIDNRNNLVDFLTEDQRGQHLPEYYDAIEEAIFKDYQVIREHLGRVKETADEIAKIVASQHGLIGLELLVEKVHITELIESILSYHGGLLKENQILVKRSYCELPSLFVHKSKFLFVLSNLIENACEAMNSNANGNRVLHIETGCEEKFAFICVSDNGIGIDQKDLVKIFAKAYSPKSNSLDCSLHNCANYISEMGGTIKAESQGKNEGACISIKLPLSKASG
jgi:signal transduction histidine kinase